MNILLLTNNKVSLPLYTWFVAQGENVKLQETALVESDLEDIEWIISYNYRSIISKDLLNKKQGKFINLHNSLLPWNRGVSPNIWAFIEGTPLGITIHQMNEGLDTGDILLQEELYFDFQTETLASSYEKSHEQMRNLFKSHWNNLKKGKINPQKQTGEGSYHRTQEIEKYKPYIDYNITIQEFLNRIEKAEMEC